MKAHIPKNLLNCTKLSLKIVKLPWRARVPVSDSVSNSPTPYLSNFVKSEFRKIFLPYGCFGLLNTRSFEH